MYPWLTAILNAAQGDWAERPSLDCIKSEGSLGFAELGIEPQDIEKNVRYMERCSPQGARGLFAAMGA